MNSLRKYKIAENYLLGRYLEAKIDIDPGESIIDELPLISGPVSSSTTNLISGPSDPSGNIQDVCPVCCLLLANKSKIIHCTNCNLPLCSISCHEDPLHNSNECRIFQNFPRNRIPYENKKILYNFINTIRCLFLRMRNPGVKWAQMVQLQGKVEELEKVGTFFKDFDELFSLLKWEYFLDDDNQDKHNLPEENIQSLARHSLGVMRINAFSTFTNSHAREGLYFLSSLMAHSCQMNTDRQIDPNDGRMVTRAGVKIQKGEVITTSYLSYMNGTPERYRETKNTWLFVCKCTRCVDPSECGSCLSTVICSNCKEMSMQPYLNGLGLGESNEDSKLTWKCEKCLFVLCNIDKNNEAEIVQSSLVEFVEKSKPIGLKDIDAIEEWLDTFDNGRFIHTNHSTFAQIKLYLCQYYGRDSNGIQKLETDRLIRKVKYCLQILEIFRILFDGIYLLKGIILFELWVSLQEIRRRIMEKAQPDLSDQEISHDMKDFLKVDYSESKIEEIRIASLEILKYALPNSAEESMAEILTLQ